MPTEIKRLKGTLQNCRTNKSEPQYPKLDLIPVPDHFDDVAAGEWNRVVAMLAPIGVLQATDIAVLEGYCISFSNYRRAQEIVSKQGPFVKDLNGIPKKNPAWAQVNECLSVMMRYAVELGLTPVSRSRVSAPAKKQAGEFDDF